jgi:predicted extracellular nuclease
MTLSVESRRWLIALSAVLMLLLVVPAVPVVGAGHLTPIYDIQGAGHISPENGNSVATQGVITAIGFRALYVQDPNGDGDDATSDAIFVFDFGFGSRSVGECVELDGFVSEFIGGGAATGNLSTTQMFDPDIDVIDCEATFGPGYSFPSPVVIGLGGRVPPNVIVISEDEIDPPINLQDAVDDAANNFNPDVDGIDFYESLEAMLVTVEDAQAVSANRRFSTFSAEFFTVPNRGDRAIIEPNSVMTQRGGILLQPHPDGTGDLNPERVQIQLSGTPLYPGDMNLQVKVGDLVGDVTGVVGYSFGNFEINALHEITVVDGGLTAESTSLNITDNRLSVASYNVLNLSVAGTGDMAQADALGAQIVNNLESPDVIALQEIQDDSAETDDGTTTAEATLQMLVDAIAGAGGPTYVAFDVEPVNNTQGGAPGANIRNAFLYNPNRVDLVDSFALSAAVLIAAGADPTAFDGSRIPLVGVFEFNGSEFTVISVHNSSRFGSTPIFGGPQPFVQAGEAEREAQSNALNQYVDSLLAGDSDAQIMVAGDFNTFEFTDELLEDMPGPEPALNNLVPFKDKNPNRGNQFGQEGFYSFIFDGNSQMLDHFFVTSSLLPSAKFDVVHVNVDFPRTFINTTASDHEPLLATFSLAK